MKRIIVRLLRLLGVESRQAMQARIKRSMKVIQQAGIATNWLHSQGNRYV